MSDRPSLKQRALAALPRSVADRVRAATATRNRRALEAKLVDAPAAFSKAYDAYWETGQVPAGAEELLFLATWASEGELPRSRASERGSTFDPSAYASFDDDLLSELDPEEAARGVAEEGFYVAPFRLRNDVVDDILTVLESGPAEPRGDMVSDMKPGVPQPSAPTWWMQPADTLRSAAARRLLRERRLAETAGRYLGVDPMIMSVVLWESFAWQAADARSAQEFHYDNDRSSFLKMFVYLTDVDDQTGPHTYVPRSHRRKPKELLHGGRLGDDVVGERYPRSGWQTITGPRGTVFFADTQGFHKGGRLLTGKRAMFQINLATDRFGVHEPPVGSSADAPDDLRPYIGAAPRYFGQLFAPDVSVP